MDVCLLRLFFIVWYSSLRRADHLSAGVVQIVVCLSTVSKPQQ